MPYNKKYYERRWLNVRHGRAYSIASIESYGGECNDVFLEVGDCSESITLDFCFNVSDKKDFNKQLKKLDKFIETCQKLRAAMVEVEKNGNKNDAK